MSIRIIRTGNDQALREIAKPVTQVNRAIEKLLDDMAETMYNAPGIGLAANQIGVLKRLVVIDVEDGHGLREFINPEILEKSGTQKEFEGCLSIPGLRGEVTRALNVTVRAQNRHGETFTLEASDLLARCIQHEVDHLDGILFTDYLSPSEIVHEREGSRRR